MLTCDICKKGLDYERVGVDSQIIQLLQDEAGGYYAYVCSTCSPALVRALRNGDIGLGYDEGLRFLKYSLPEHKKEDGCVQT